MLIRRLDLMILQGFSNAIYGLGLMHVTWSNMEPDLCAAIEGACLRAFNKDVPKDNQQASQSIANIIYSFGNMGAVWSDLSLPIRTALCTGIDIWNKDLKSQELSNIVYGLGIMRASYQQLPPETQLSLFSAIQRVKGILNQQEVCSTLHGYAKMGAVWSQLPDKLKSYFLDSIRVQTNIGVLCLACTIYALGNASYPVVLDSSHTNGVSNRICLCRYDGCSMVRVTR
jgi:hypothetical protein